MGITTTTLRHALDRAALAARAAETALNAADAKMGDGDTGLTVRRLFDALAAGQPRSGEDLGDYFADLARICAGATGSSLGTLVTVSMMALAKALPGQVEMPWRDLSPRLADLRDRMLARGGASLGDKTVVDMIDAVARACAGLDTPAALTAAARSAARESLDRMRDQPNRIGRARMFADRSVGLDDPGMLAFMALLDAVTEAVHA